MGKAKQKKKGVFKKNVQMIAFEPSDFELRNQLHHYR